MNLSSVRGLQIYTKVYEKILDGKGFGVLDALPAIDVVTKN